MKAPRRSVSTAWATRSYSSAHEAGELLSARNRDAALLEFQTYRIVASLEPSAREPTWTIVGELGDSLDKMMNNDASPRRWLMAYSRCNSPCLSAVDQGSLGPDMRTSGKRSRRRSFACTESGFSRASLKSSSKERTQFPVGARGSSTRRPWQKQKQHGSQHAGGMSKNMNVNAGNFSKTPV